MRLTFGDATESDVAAINELHNAVAQDLTARFGKGHWSYASTEKGVAHSLKHAKLRIGRSGKRIVTVLRLAKKKPWAIDLKHFSKVKRPFYLTSMAVAPELQGQGLGRACLEQVAEIARKKGADYTGHPCGGAACAGRGRHAADVCRRRAERLPL